MCPIRLITLLILFFPIFGSAAEPAPLPLLSPLFGEHMMLQRNQPNHLWGWAAPGTKITVSFAGQEKTAAAGPDGKWLVTLDPLPASAEPRELFITTGNQKSYRGRPAADSSQIQNQKFHDVLVGDIWLCSGQSNMEFELARARDGAEAVKNSTEPAIRLFRVASQPAYAPVLAPRGEWRRCEPAAFERPGGFSAVAYYFGRKLHAETGVPIGLIQAAVGGSPAESFMSPEALGRFPEFAPGLAIIDRLKKRGGPVYGSYVMHWYDEFDRGVAGAWQEPGFDDAAWKTVSLHNGFARLGVPDAPAVVWFRREITLPDPLPPGKAKLLLGVVERMDTAWLNGHWIGASSWVENPRAYTIPDGVLHPGRNQITLRVLKTVPDGGFRSPAEKLQLTFGDGTAIPLEGEWRAAASVDARPPHPLPLGYENWPTMPTVLYFGMVRPLAPLALTGALWYQGEANTTRARQYRTLLPALIADWRALFAQPELPFYIVSLPSFSPRRTQPGGGDGWAELREAQALAAQNVPHTGLAVTIDVGDADNLHPIDKQPVGERLALLALRHNYGRDVVCDGPTFARAEKIPHALRLHFAHTDGGLVVKGERLGEFSLAGADHVWHWADAKIDGDTIIVSSPDVPEPVAARYAWQSNPLATLYNGAGLPAVPFRTDD
jgi:sialate O-acetylesterase